MSTQVEILVNGKPVKQYRHSGNLYVEARNNTEYSIKVKNSHPDRILAVVTVDGVNVVSGEPQDDSAGNGYVVQAHDSVEIKGYRKDLNNVGAFKFCQKGHSYSKEVGLKNNNGVIGVRVYSEDFQTTLNKVLEELNKRKSDWVKPIPDYPFKNDWFKTNPDYSSDYTFNHCVNDDASGSIQCSSSSTSTATYSSGVLRSCNQSPNFDMGSTWGKKINDSARYTDFEVGCLLDEHIIYYDSRGNLSNIGVVFKKEKEVYFPKAFNAPFAKPPKGWDG